jgi:methionine synthase I (cobalamin-dependent)
MSFNRTKQGFYTLMGNSVDLCINALIKSGADIVGSNCNLGSNDMADLVTVMKQNLYSRSKKYPLIAQANAGQPEIINGKSVYPTTSDRYLLDVITMIKKGLDVVGGCCGTTPEYIRKIHEYVKHCQKSVRKREHKGKYP